VSVDNTGGAERGAPVTREVAVPAPQDVLTEAHGIIRGPRRHFYGDPKVNFQTIADLWNGFLRARMREEGLHIELDDFLQLVRPEDVAHMMVLLKTARSVREYHRDSVVDTGGYAALVEVLCDAEAYEAFSKKDDAEA
jgi:hypothetical protein